MQRAKVALNKRFFDVCADHLTFADQWFLDEPLAVNGEEIDARQFTSGTPYRGPLPVIVPIGNPGLELAFNLGAFDMPVVSSAVANIIRNIAPDDVQCFPVDVPAAQGSYQILNAGCSLDCLDEERSEFTRWLPGDHRADRVGQYHRISTIRVDVKRTCEHRVFRIKNWPVALLVSNTIKDAIASIPRLGIVFETAS